MSQFELLSTTKSPIQTLTTTNKSMSSQQNIISIIDKSLLHLNQICQANIVVQDLYMELLKQKRTMKFEQIKKIYMTLTEGKAKQVLFERDKQQLTNTDYQNHQGLVRLCWRSIEKLIKKITYYIVNQNSLSPISKSVLNLIHLNQQFVRRSQKVKNSSMLFVIQIIEKLILQNSILQRKIYDILLNRGYVVSLDQFYKLNGYDAEHRDAYQATITEDVQQHAHPPQEPIHNNNNTQTSHPLSLLNHKKPFTRKKKVFKSGSKPTWKLNVPYEEQSQKKSHPLDKTNFQIKQSFEKLIGDFLQNQNLNEIFNKYNSQEEDGQKIRKNSQTKKLNESLIGQGIIQKRIFQNKMQTVISQLKSNTNIKVNSKLLEIINHASFQAINSKYSSNNKLKDRKNSNTSMRQSGQRKSRELYMINDRKLVNQHLYRELLKRNASMEKVLHQQIAVNTSKIQNEIQALHRSSKTQDDNAIEFSIIEHNQNSSTNIKKKSRISKSQQGNKIIMFKSHQKPKPQNLLKRSFKLFQKKVISNDIKEDNKQYNEFVEGDKSLLQKIRIAKEDWQFKNQKDIFETIQNSQFDPLNHMKIAEIVQFLNSNKKDQKIDSFLRQLFSNQRSQFTRNDWIRTQNGQRIKTSPKIRDLSSDFDPTFQKTHSSNFNLRVKTEMSPRRRNDKIESSFAQIANLRKKPYEVFDCRMRRVIRQ